MARVLQVSHQCAVHLVVTVVREGGPRGNGGSRVRGPVLEAILCLLPALALALPLFVRRYPGERLLSALRGRRQVRWPHPRSSARVRRGVLLVAAHGGLLIARSLAVRPPPAVTLAS